MKKIFCSLLGILGLFIKPSQAQQVRPMPSSEIYLKLQQLNNLGTVMYVAAHPDDENTRLIAYLVHREHVRTIYYSLTRGDGGQNILGNEQGPALGLIRTHELLKAREMDGAEQMFSPFIDFGYTTSVPETLNFWNEKKLIKDMVEAIQATHPDMLICRFPTTGEGGHGNHTVSAIIAKEAWEYIKQYNDTAKNKLWLPKRVLFNAFQFGSHTTLKPGQFKMRINQYDPLLGEGLGELAGKSRSEHKSQGAGTSQVIGTTIEHFEVMNGPALKNNLFDGIDTGWSKVGATNIGASINQVIQNFNFENPSASLPDLLKVRNQLQNIKDPFWRNQKIKEINKIILSCAGVMAEALTQTPTAVAGETLPVKLDLIARSQSRIEFIGFTSTKKLENNTTSKLLMNNDSLYQFNFKVNLPEDEPLTQPYWMAVPPIHNEYQFPSKYMGMPEAPNNLGIKVNLKINGDTISVFVPFSYKKLDPVRGDVTQRLRIVPGLSVEPTENLYVYEPGLDKNVTLHIKTFEQVQDPMIMVIGEHMHLQHIMLPDLRAGLDTFITVTVNGEFLSMDSSTKTIYFDIVYNDQSHDLGIHLIDYPHIPELQYFTRSDMTLVPKDWQVSVKKVGYFEGVGDYVDDVLRLCGLEVDQINGDQLNDTAFLGQFDAIVVGIRAFNTKKDLVSGIDGLLNYVQNGGTLIVQYNKMDNLKTDKLGPYPIKLVYDRVTDETAPVQFLNPNASLLNFPNKITEKDFDGWVQERGLYFPGQWDKSHYQTILSMHDQDKPELDGSVLYTPFGKGQYIYTSLAFFRQLPAGNEGAIRLFMNFLSAGKQK